MTFFSRYYFLLQMSQRSYTGKMNFDFEKETLEILVNTSQESSNRVGTEVKDLKSLSGGERSFSTVCFILSLWEAMESPFRCLDEFDIFMVSFLGLKKLKRGQTVISLLPFLNKSILLVLCAFLTLFSSV